MPQGKSYQNKTQKEIESIKDIEIKKSFSLEFLYKFIKSFKIRKHAREKRGNCNKR
jgi:hypothetical protein